MSGAERRISPRKPCVVPVRFRIAANGGRETLGLREAARNSVTHEGEVLNLSENGVYFTSRMKLSVGEPLASARTYWTGSRAGAVQCASSSRGRSFRFGRDRRNWRRCRSLRSGCGHAGLVQLGTVRDRMMIRGYSIENAARR